MNTRSMRLLIAAVAAAALTAPLGVGAQEKSKFYDFSDQLIDGEIKKPMTVVLETRQRAKFDKLLRLKKSFRPALIETAKERLLK